VEYEETPSETDAVLLVEGLYFPVKITEWVLEETSNIFECSPFLCHIARLSCGIYEFSEITIGFLSKRSIMDINILEYYYSDLTFQSYQLSH